MTDIFREVDAPWTAFGLGADHGQTGNYLLNTSARELGVTESSGELPISPK
jgi:hypothetical protein